MFIACEHLLYFQRHKFLNNKNLIMITYSPDNHHFCLTLVAKESMETVIKVTPAELNITLLDRIKLFIGNKKNIAVTISLKEFDPDYTDLLSSSIAQAESGDIISMTMEEFTTYTPDKK